MLDCGFSNFEIPRPRNRSIPHRMPKNLRVAMAARDLTVEGIAARLGDEGKTRSWVSQILSGHRKGEDDRPIIAALIGKSEEWLAREIDRAKAHRRNTNPDRAPRGPYPS